MPGPHPVAVLEELAPRRRRWTDRQRRRTLLWLGDRCRPAERDRCRLAHLHMGPERRTVCLQSGRGHRRGGRRRVAQGHPRPARKRIVRVRDRVPDGSRDLPRRGTLRRAGAGGLGCRARRAGRRSPGPAADVVGGPRHHGAGGALSGARHRQRDRAPERRQRPAPAGVAPRRRWSRNRSGRRSWCCRRET